MRSIKLFNAFAGVTTLGVFLEAVTAGLFMALHGGAARGWESAHHIIAWVTLVFAVVTAVIAIVGLRTKAMGLVIAAVLLAVLLLIQSLLGQSIEGTRVLFALHVPLAFVVFALAIWLSVRGALVRRTVAAA